MRNFTRCGLLSILVACGGDGARTEALIAGSVAGSFEGRTFTAVNGITTTLTEGNQSQEVIGLGDESIYCGIENSTEPPDGSGVIIRAAQFTMGSQSLIVSVFETDDGGNYRSVGTMGTLDVTSMTETSIAATLSFDATIDGMEYAANGTFEAIRCP